MTEKIERHVAAPPARVWELWTTPAGIEQWWAPEGFRTDVQELELEEGGALVYTMTAIGPEQVEFMEQNGMPLTTESRKTFTEVREPSRLGYVSHVDFVPGREPYDHLTVVDLREQDGGTLVVMTVEPMHDDVWTQRIVAGRANELDNLARLVGGS
jgi:uncharacterized protein YndB with AHSA1/START domain